MPLVEIDENELRNLRTLQNTVSTVMKDPIAKLKVQEAVKRVIPNAQTPELDNAVIQYKLDEERESRIAALEKQIADDKAQREADEKLRGFKSQVDSGFDKLRQDGWTEAGIDEVRKIMEEKGITDHAIAAAYWEKLHPPQAPVAPNGRGGWNFMEQLNDGDADLKKLIESKGENSALVDKMAYDALTEMRQSTRR
jgi:hypothetical protein